MRTGAALPLVHGGYGDRNGNYWRFRIDNGLRGTLTYGTVNDHSVGGHICSALVQWPLCHCPLLSRDKYGPGACAHWISSVQWTA